MTSRLTGPMVCMNTNRKEIVMCRSCRIGPIVVASVLALCAGQVAFAQVDWTYGDLAVPPGPPGSWNEGRNLVGDVVFDGTTYHMYLIGGPDGNPLDNSWSVGHWTWNDLTLQWDPDPCSPVMEPEPGRWDAFTIGHLAVLYDGAEFRMWYGATDSYHGAGRGGYATNTDGRCYWDKHGGNPLAGLEPGPVGAWNENGAWPSSVVFDGSTYHMWFTAGEGDTWDGTWGIGHATSMDGLSWTMDPDPAIEATESWDGDKVTFPEVVRIGDGFAMWYSGFFMSPVTAAIGYAVSPDGLHWGKWPGNPVLSPRPGYPTVESPSMIIEGDMIHGWVTHYYEIEHVTSPFELLFFDGFESGDTSIWGGSVP